MAQGELPAIVWSGGTITFGYPLQNAVAYSEPKPGYEWADVPSGEVDAWVAGHFQFLAADVPNVPGVNTTTPPATGWDGAAGWRAFLEAARDGEVFTFQPQAGGAGVTCVLMEPRTGAPTQEPDLTRRVRLVIRSTTDTPFTGY